MLICERISQSINTFNIRLILISYYCFSSCCHLWVLYRNKLGKMKERGVVGGERGGFGSQRNGPSLQNSFPPPPPLSSLACWAACHHRLEKEMGGRKTCRDGESLQAGRSVKVWRRGDRSEGKVESRENARRPLYVDSNSQLVPLHRRQSYIGDRMKSRGSLWTETRLTCLCFLHRLQFFKPQSLKRSHSPPHKLAACIDFRELNFYSPVVSVSVVLPQPFKVHNMDDG